MVEALVTIVKGSSMNATAVLVQCVKARKQQHRGAAEQLCTYAISICVSPGNVFWPGRQCSGGARPWCALNR